MGSSKPKIFTTARLHVLFGDGHFIREPSDTASFSFVAPKARALAGWSSEAARTLKLEQGDYLAVLAEAPNSNFVIAYHPCAPASWVEYQGRGI